MTLVYSALCWTAGIIMARLLAPSIRDMAVATVAGAFSLLWAWPWPRWRKVALLAIVLLLGGWRLLLGQPGSTEHSLAQYNERGRVLLEGPISADLSSRGRRTQVELSAQKIKWQGQWRPVRGKVVFYVPFWAEHRPGDVLQVSGKLETPVETPEFSYREYLLARGVESVLNQERVESVQATGKLSLLRLASDSRRAMLEVLSACLPQPDAGLLGGILVGQDHPLPGDLADAFRAVGLTHIIVVSGSNVSLVVQAVLLSAGRLLSRRLALSVSLGVILLYALFVGASTPVLRAGLMGLLFALGQLLGRRSHAPTALAATAVAMLAWNPLLLWQVSFQLSFAATLALVVLAPAMERGLTALRESPMRALLPARDPGWVRRGGSLLVATIAAQMVTLPIIWYHFNEISLISPLANLLVLPVQPALMLGGFFALLLGVIWRPIGTVAGWCVLPLSRYCLLVIRTLASLPWAAIPVPHGGQAWYAGLAVVAFCGLCGTASRQRRQWVVKALQQAWRSVGSHWWPVAAAGLAAILVWGAVLSLPDGRTHLYFLDVGQGDAILIRSPRGRYILVDGGADPVRLAAHLGWLLPFWSRRIDLLVATHADQDHLGGLLAVARRFNVQRALEPVGMGDGELSRQWRKVLAERGVPLGQVMRGTQVTLGTGICLEVLHPTGNVAAEEQGENRSSMVIRLEAGRFRALLTADADERTEQELGATDPSLQATVLKVAHHGARSGTSAEFLAAVAPRYAVISVGENDYGHPAEEVLERLRAAGCRLLRTDEHGTVEFITDGRRLWLKTGRRGVESGEIYGR